MREVPLKMTGQLEAVEDQVAGLEEVRSDRAVALEDRAQRAAALVGERRSEGGGRERHQVLEPGDARAVRPVSQARTTSIPVEWTIASNGLLGWMLA